MYTSRSPQLKPLSYQLNMMHDAPIQPRAMTQTALRSDTRANKLTSIADFGIHHASKLARLLLSQSREMSVVRLLIMQSRIISPNRTSHCLV